MTPNFISYSRLGEMYEEESFGNARSGRAHLF